MQLNDLLDTKLLERMLTAKNVSAQKHPSLPLRILNYTKKCAHDRVWNDVTEQCRGLIYNSNTLEVVSRPFRKFYNYGDASLAMFPLNAPVVVTDKLDGSLGILYPVEDGVDDGWAVASRGSFTSPQAVWASAKMAEYVSLRGFEPQKGVTYLFEIIYPENRIVVDYAGLTDLVFIGAVQNNTGASYEPIWSSLGWPGPSAEVFPYRTLRDLLSSPWQRHGKEGLVIRQIGTNNRVKLKQEDYVALHRIVTGLNARTVWEAIKEQRLQDVYDVVPLAFHSWIGEVESAIIRNYTGISLTIEMDYDTLQHDPIATANRRGFAEAAKLTTYPWAMFNILDGNSNAERIWQMCKPRGDWKAVADADAAE